MPKKFEVEAIANKNDSAFSRCWVCEQVGDSENGVAKPDKRLLICSSKHKKREHLWVLCGDCRKGLLDALARDEYHETGWPFKKERE